MAHRIVVLGAGYAGLTAANRIRARVRGADVTLVNARDRFVERVRLHEFAAGRRLRDLPLRDLVRSGVKLVVGEVVAVEPAGAVVHLRAAPHRLAYDTLIYALGSTGRVDRVPGSASAVASYEAAAALRDRLANRTGTGLVVVIGAGLTGLETAAELAEAHPRRRVELVTAGTLGDGLSARGRRYLHRQLAGMGVTVREGTRVAEAGEHGVLLADGPGIAADAVVAATGFRAPPLAAEAGLAVDDIGRIRVDGMLRSISDPQIYAAGDAAAPAAPDGCPARMCCQTALPMGVQVADIVAAALTGRRPRPARVRYVWQNISLGRHDGLTQFVRLDDRPLDAVMTGRASARFKEAVTRGTVLALGHPGPYLTRGRML